MKPTWLCRLFGHKFKLNYADASVPTDYCTRCGMRPWTGPAHAPHERDRGNPTDA